MAGYFLGGVGGVSWNRTRIVHCQYEGPWQLRASSSEVWKLDICDPSGQVESRGRGGGMSNKKGKKKRNKSKKTRLKEAQEDS